MYLISAYFDAQSNKVLNRYIKQIAEKTENRFMLSHQVPPHMTVSQIEARSEEVLIAHFYKLQDELHKGSIEMASIGMMMPYVIYAMPVFNQYLLDLSMDVYCAFNQIDETKISKYYKPMSWIPHITLGKTLTKEQMLGAVSILQDGFVPMTAEITEIGLARVNPHEDIVRFTLH
ncbi:MAG: 2'-5' RNA ligase family protein [Lachnospiraceae bacterium]